MNIFSALKVLRVAAIVVAPAIIGQLIWPSHTKWGFTYSLGFSLIGGIILGLLAEKFLGKRKSSPVHPL
jgi:Na+/proline symporter